MNKKIIHAISFLHNGERVVVKATAFGKFRVPVVKVEGGSLKTRMRALTALEIIKHDIIKNCDPTFYLQNNERLRVYPGGDPGYLPAQSEGIAEKHDQANASVRPKIENKKAYKPAKRFDYEQASFELYGWYPDYDGTD